MKRLKKTLKKLPYEEKKKKKEKEKRRCFKRILYLNSRNYEEEWGLLPMFFEEKKEGERGEEKGAAPHPMSLTSHPPYKKL